MSLALLVSKNREAKEDEMTETKCPEKALLNLVNEGNGLSHFEDSFNGCFEGWYRDEGKSLTQRILSVVKYPFILLVSVVIHHSN